VFLKQGDLFPPVVGDLNADVTGATVQVILRKAHSSTVITKSCTLTDAVNGIVTAANWAAGETDIVGTYWVEFKVTFAGGAIERFPQRSYRELIIRPKVG
jgi:hypothetical protein